MLNVKTKPTKDDPHYALLARLIGEGKSAAQVSAETDLGSRNAVLGLAWRMGLRFKGSRSGGMPKGGVGAQNNNRIEAASRLPPPRMAEASALNTPPRVAGTGESGTAVCSATPAPAPAIDLSTALQKLAVGDVAIPESGRVQLVHLTERMCKWPLGDPRAEDFHFCGADKPAEGGAYCARHMRIAYESREVQRRRDKWHLRGVDRSMRAVG